MRKVSNLSFDMKKKTFAFTFLGKTQYLRECPRIPTKSFTNHRHEILFTMFASRLRVDTHESTGNNRSDRPNRHGMD